MARRIAQSSLSDTGAHIQEHLGRATRELFGNQPGSPNFGALHMEPPVDVFETRTDVVVSVEIAGIMDEEVEVIVEGRLMIIRGQRRALSGPAERAYHLMEIGHGPFQREIQLPCEVNPEELRDVYKDGILQISVPKAQTSRGRQLRIVVR
ncbi:MAG TPA: Hsp20/alpha crystallin family protein [Dehalococcoidia bacterium]|jgi:HSP20 family protein|nr:Hsp20/alpha crystallin family protein [Dehalococcoidia bacterium]